MPITLASLGKHIAALEGGGGYVFAVVVLNGPADSLDEHLEDMQIGSRTHLIVLDLSEREWPSQAVKEPVARPAPNWIKHKVDLNGAYIDDGGRPLPRKEAVKTRPAERAAYPLGAFGIDIQDD